MTDASADAVVDTSVDETGAATPHVAQVAPPIVTRFAQWVRSSGIGVPIAVWAASRFTILAAAVASTWLRPDAPLLGILHSYDGLWFERIAAQGYPASVTAEVGGGNRWGFFPAWPALIRVAQRLTGGSFAAVAIVTAALVGLVATLAIWQAVVDVLGRRTADGTIAVICFLPSAYVLGMSYSESLLLVAVGIAFVALHRQWWWLAGVAAALAGATRLAGLAVVAVVVAASAVAIVRDRDRRAVGGLLLAPLGFLAWIALQWSVTGSPLAFVRAQAAFGNQSGFLVDTLSDSVKIVTEFGLANGPPLLGAASLVVVVVGVVAMARHRDIPWTWWMFTLLVVISSFTSTWVRTNLRYLLPAFPMYAAFVAWLPRRFLPVWVGCSAALMGMLALVVFQGVVGTLPFPP